VFRQWKAETTHCKYIHGYGVSFKVWFEGDLDERNWVWDFGGMKRTKGTIDGMSPKDWMDYMFDHTFIVAEDDPFKESFLKMNEAGAAQIRVIPATGAEKFAEYIYNKLNPFIKEETQGRVKVVQVEFREHGKNTAIFTSYDDKVDNLTESAPAIGKSGEWGENTQSEK
jgi:6-pyruvoyltetrahydropterin/6-carboxytetrahydropterin synthase